MSLMLLVSAFAMAVAGLWFPHPSVLIALVGLLACLAGALQWFAFRRWQAAVIVIALTLVMWGSVLLLTRQAPFFSLVGALCSVGMVTWLLWSFRFEDTVDWFWWRVLQTAVVVLGIFVLGQQAGAIEWPTAIWWAGPIVVLADWGGRVAGGGSMSRA